MSPHTQQQADKQTDDCGTDPHVYNDYEKFNFGNAKKPYIEFPIMEDGSAYNGDGSPGADRVVRLTILSFILDSDSHASLFVPSPLISSTIPTARRGTFHQQADTAKGPRKYSNRLLISSLLRSHYA